jgi:hypothetical protein
MTEATSTDASNGEWRFEDLRALYVNCTLKRSPEPSHTQGLIDRERRYACSSLMNVLYSLQHLGYTIPPQADAGWIGAAGPGPSYLDPGSGGPENDFTNRNTTFATWNLLHLGALLKRSGGIPAHGNQRSEWDAGCRDDFENPEHR